MIRDEATKKPSPIGEFALWILVGLFATAMALVAMTGAKYLLGWNEAQWIAATAVVGACSITWGSWAALLWTRSRVLKTMMVAVTILPAVLMLAGAIWAFFAMPENPWVWRWGWLIVGGHGLGALAVVGVVGGRKLFASSASAKLRPRQLVIGWTFFPLVVVAGSVGVVAVTWALLPDLLTCEMTPLAAVAYWVIPSQALVLLTTVLPAGTAEVCDRLTRASEK